MSNSTAVVTPTSGLVARSQSSVLMRLLATDPSPENFFHRTCHYKRLLAHVDELGLSIEEVGIEREMRYFEKFKAQIVTQAGQLTFEVSLNNTIFEGREEALKLCGILPEWLPGAPMQRKTSSKAHAEFMGANRYMKLRKSGQRVLVYLSRDDDEDGEIDGLNEAEASAVHAQKRMMDAKQAADKEVKALPNSPAAFVKKYIDMIDFFAKPTIFGMQTGDGGFSVDVDDLEDFRFALGDALNVLRNASVKFDANKWEEQVLQIVDGHVNRAMPSEKRE